MLKTFLLYELKYTLKQPMVYIFTLIFAVLAVFLLIEGISVGGSNVYLNAPFAITFNVITFSIFGLLTTTAFFNNAALRDHKNNFNEILFTTPLRKSGYFFGRFFGALLISTLPLLGVYIGLLLVPSMNTVFNWTDPSNFGGFYLETFINNYFLFILPNIYVAGVVVFAIATKTKNTILSFVGALALIVLYLVSRTFLSDIDSKTTAALFDVFGLNTYGVETSYFTPVEKNTISPSFSGLLLYNRLIWVSIATVILAITYSSFSFKKKNEKIKKDKELETKDIALDFKPSTVHPAYGAQGNWEHFKSFFLINFISIAKSVTFKIILFFCVVLLLSRLWGGYEYLGLQSYPLTYKLVDSINEIISIFNIIILIFFSGELIWRDRDSHIQEVIDSTPYVSFISMAAKALSLLSIVTLFHFCFIFIGIIYQLLNGFMRIELDVYLLSFLYEGLPYYTAYAGLSMLIQVLSKNKYIGYFICILFVLGLETLLIALGISSNMLFIGSGPQIRYSDMNGFGPGLSSRLWFNLYWSLLAIILLFMAGALWNRGTKSSVFSRIKKAKKEVPKGHKVFIIALVALWVTLAGFIYYNTQVLNPYFSHDEKEQLAADYENKFSKYADAKHPKITDIKYNIDIFPNERNIHVKASISLTNESNQAIDSLHFFKDKDWVTKLTIPNATVIEEDDTFSYELYKLNPALLPGETIVMQIDNKFITNGFKNGNIPTTVVKNGSFFTNKQILPIMGYSEEGELRGKNKRKEYGLKAKNIVPKLTTYDSVLNRSNYISNGWSDFITFETTISTIKGQTAIAPGSLIKQWEEGERAYYQYKVDTSSLDFYSFTSANYELRERDWNGISLEVYYDEKHPDNVEMMLDAMERSLDYYTKNFGPYYHKQCRIVEFPRYATFAQAFPGTMPYSEAFGFVMNLEDKTDNNIIDAIISHEMAHQWWAHQVIGANMQGMTFLSESFSEYASLMTMNSISANPTKTTEFLKYDHDRYLKGRSNESEREVPLYKVEYQDYLYYPKGGITLYALQDYIGEDKVNAALRGFLEEYRYTTPYPSSLDFLRYLEPQVPDSLNHLINDWFKEITLYDNRLKEASYQKLTGSEKYEITLKIESSKIKSDSLGNETVVPINDYIDIGAFSDEDMKNLFFEKRVKINKSEMTLVFEVDSIPSKLAIDPRRLLIEKNYEDNLKKPTKK